MADICVCCPVASSETISSVAAFQSYFAAALFVPHWLFVIRSRFFLDIPGTLRRNDRCMSFHLKLDLAHDVSHWYTFGSMMTQFY